MSASSTPTRALGGQRQRQVGGGGALAHAALARGHGDDVLHLRQQRQPALRGVRATWVAMCTDVAHARQRTHGGHQAWRSAALALGRIAQLEVERHVGAHDLHVLQLRQLQQAWPVAGSTTACTACCTSCCSMLMD
jgi:hypothetical protein